MLTLFATSGDSGGSTCLRARCNLFAATCQGWRQVVPQLRGASGDVAALCFPVWLSLVDSATNFYHFLRSSVVVYFNKSGIKHGKL